MKSVILCFVATAFLIASFDVASARSRGECLTMAQQRGFNGGGKQAKMAKQDFMKACVRGQQN